ncbi:Similar to transposase [Paracoccidioides brasiliensis]; acc. no. ACY56713 [Pyronema omphalodes CBS 100304]|uniref:Similar to transposase [Paracoccidioides brasiliensis] acc. no. ACY56713 n=1 Tax=Pyronema omphalodes (strain CBS 100304) TaxID=1076935 RepID=U4LPR6_PYROM|nr:Similar to transposase [Paracoccidioides brasiliensis]; acc. no. ACY56713 [Pyronema omphalodes CBS 100304]
MHLTVPVFPVHHPLITIPRVKVRADKFSKREARIHQALEKRAAEGTPYQELELEFGVPASTLSDRQKGTQNRQKAQAEQQALPPAVEDSLERWAIQMDEQGFPARLDLFKAMALEMMKRHCEEMKSTIPSTLGPTWL